MDQDRLDETVAARELLERYGDRAERRGSPVFLKVRAAADGRLPTREVVEPGGLLGRTVGQPWSATAIVGTGRVRSLDDAHEPPAVLVPGLAGGLRLACLVSRRGITGWRMRLPDGSFYDVVPEEGFMIDVLRRSLELPTAPPPATTARLDLTAWAGALSAGPAGRLRWEEALACHPALFGETVTDTEAAEALVRAVPSIADWESLRLFVASGFDSDYTPSAEVAAWMDAGMFSRWVLRELPPVDAVLPTVRDRLHPAAYRRFSHLARTLDDRTCVR